MIQPVNMFNSYPYLNINTHIRFQGNKDSLSQQKQSSLTSKVSKAIAASAIASLLMTMPSHLKTDDEISINKYQQQVETEVPFYIKELNEIISQKQIESLNSKIDRITQESLSEVEKVTIIKDEINKIVKKTCILLASKFPEERKKNIEFLKQHSLYMATILTDDKLSDEDKIHMIADRMGMHKRDEVFDKTTMMLSIVCMIIGLSIGGYMGFSGNGLMGLAILAAAGGLAGKYIGLEVAKEYFTPSRYEYNEAFQTKLRDNLRDYTKYQNKEIKVTDKLQKENNLEREEKTKEEEALKAIEEIELNHF